MADYDPGKPHCIAKLELFSFNQCVHIVRKWQACDLLYCLCSSFFPLCFDYQLAISPSHHWASLSSLWLTIDSFLSRAILIFRTTWFLLKPQQKPLIEESLRISWSLFFSSKRTSKNTAKSTPGHEFIHWNVYRLFLGQLAITLKLGKWFKIQDFFLQVKDTPWQRTEIVKRVLSLHWYQA